MAASVIESMVPENMRAIVPDLPAAQKIKWVYEAAKAGIFTTKQQSGPDAKRPNEKPPQDFYRLITTNNYGPRLFEEIAPGSFIRKVHQNGFNSS